MRSLFVAVLILLAIPSNAQNIKTYSWAEKPVFKEAPEEFKDAPALVLKDFRWVETRVNDWQFTTFLVKHKAIKINKLEALNKYNKVKADNNGYNVKVKDFHARIIKPNGSIQVLSEDKIIESEEDKVKSIAFEGVEKGDILEYYYVLKEYPIASNVEFFQDEIPVLEAELKLKGKGVSFIYNISPAFKRIGEGRFKATNIPPLVAEEDAKNLKFYEKIIYKASKYDYENQWDYLMPLLFKKNKFYTKSGKNGKKEIQRYVASGRFNAIDTVDDKIEILEEHIRKLYIRKEDKESTKLVDEKGRKLVSYNDYFEFYITGLRALKINYQIKVLANRYVSELDLENRFSFIPTTYLIFIPETKKYLLPSSDYYSYGFVPFPYQQSRSVVYDFVDFKNPKFHINLERVPVTDKTISSISSDIAISLIEEKAVVSAQKRYLGYDAILTASRLTTIDEGDNKKMEYDEWLKTNFADNLNVEFLSSSHNRDSLKFDFTKKPLEVNVSYENSNGLIEDNGAILLVALGKLIGSQKEYSTTTPRVKPVDLAYANELFYTINFEIPKGFSIENKEDFEVEKHFYRNEESVFSVQSTTQIIDGVFRVKLSVLCSDITFTLEEFPKYNEVVKELKRFENKSLVLRKIE